MPYRLPVAVVSVLALLLGLLSAVSAQDQKGTLVIALDTLGAQTMDPILEGRAPHAHYQAPVFDSLVGFDYDKGGIGPGVAERWELDTDGSAWTFFLRAGLKWHNGDPLTAHDVKLGIYVKRDRQASVRYSERVNSRKSSFSLQRTDRHHGIVGQERSHFQRDS